MILFRITSGRLVIVPSGIMYGGKSPSYLTLVKANWRFLLLKEGRNRPYFMLDETGTY